MCGKFCDYDVCDANKFNTFKMYAIIKLKNKKQQ